MKSRNLRLAMLILAAGLLVRPVFVSARQRAQRAPKVTSANDPGAQRNEGQKRFQANCGRCHQWPQKFPPRMMATIDRHMRVRATITEKDMRLILQYMTQ